MAYTKHAWKNKGEANALPINKTNLNEMEDGIYNANSIIDAEITERRAIDDEQNEKIAVLESIVPNEASEENQLADKDFVNSSVATATANFRGTFNSVAELQAYSGEKSVNDYAFVLTVVSGLADRYDRYKYNGTSWVFEYTINTSGFTAEQLAAINSGATKDKIDSIANKENASNRVNSITSSSDNNHYPTAKAVYDIFHSIALYEGEVE